MTAVRSGCNLAVTRSSIIRLIPVVSAASSRRYRPGRVSSRVPYSFLMNVNMSPLELAPQVPGREDFPRPTEQHGPEFRHPHPPRPVPPPARIHGAADEPGDLFRLHGGQVLELLGRLDHAGPNKGEV